MSERDDQEQQQRVHQRTIADTFLQQTGSKAVFLVRGELFPDSIDGNVSYLLSIGALGSSRAEEERDNQDWFQRDMQEGRLRNYPGMGALYHKGILVGLVPDGSPAFREAASNLYGSSNLSLFAIPPDADPRHDEGRGLD